ncbi:MAG: VCBS repeat-containing protein [Planctomycetes bacterium]|nr:VCBS repeat-containing protein [Planctomycetota bacterium]
MHRPSLAVLGTAILSTTAAAQIEFTAAQRLSFTVLPERILSIDLNGDGREEVISDALGRAPEALFSLAEGTFADVPRALLPIGSYDLGFGDLDGDGDVDILGSSFSFLTTYWNDGQGNFSAGPQSVANATVVPLQMADCDGDGFLDVVLHPINSTRLELYFGDGQGNFAGGVAVPLPSEPRSFAALRLVSGSARSLAVTHADRTTSVITRTTGRSFALAAGPQLTYPSRIEQVVDFDGDSFEDVLLVGNRNDLPFTTWGVTLLSADRFGSFQPEALQHAGPEAVYVARAGSFDAVGPLDLLVVTSTEDLLWVRGATSTARFPLSFPYRAARIASGDFDGDGDLDLMRTEGFAQRVVHWENQARYELRLAFDESSGSRTFDAARGTATAPAFTIPSASRWQGDPGPGREAYRGNDAGAGMLARGSGGYLSTLQANPFLRAQQGSYTIAWWQRMGSQAPQAAVKLLDLADFSVTTGTALGTNALVVDVGPFFVSSRFLSTRPIHLAQRWVHVAFTVDVAQRQLQLFLDGQPEPAWSILSPSVPLGLFPRLALGADQLGRDRASDFFDLDELRYVPRVLTTAEIVSLQSGDAITVAPLGAGCYERRPEEGLSVSVVPTPGGLVEAKLDTTGQIGGFALLAFGVSSAQLGGSALPFDLGAGCVLRTSVDALAPMAIGRVAELAVRLPNAPGALQAHVYVQGLVFGTGVQTTRAFDLKLRY